MRCFVSLSIAMLAVLPAVAQHDPGRNAVRLLAKGEMDKGYALVQKGQPSKNLSPVDAAEVFYVKALAASMRKRPERALEHAKNAVKSGLPFSRLQAGPRDELASLHQSEAYKAWAKKEGSELVHGPLLGCVTDRSASFWVRTATPTLVRVVAQESVAGRHVSGTVSSRAESDYTAVVTVNELQENTDYTYDVFIGEEKFTGGSFRTQPSAGKGAQFTVGFGGGSGYTPQYEHMWATIRDRELNAFLTLGDNVYIDDPEHILTHRYCYYRRQSNPLWRAFSASTPVYSIYDDHDFGENDCVPGPEMEKPAWKRRVWNVFRENWNNTAYGGSDDNPGCWSDFYIADVHFILLDGRYYRDLEGGSMLGSVQKQWLLNTLKGSKGRFKVLASPVPWSPGVKPRSMDTWDGFADEREEIFSFIETERIDGVLLMAADRHRTDLRRIPRESGHNFYEVMSSRLTNVHTHPLTEGAKGSEFIFGYNKTCSFGELLFDTAKAEPDVLFRCINIEGEETDSRKISLKELSF